MDNTENWDYISNPIVLLGYAKNNILEVLDGTEDLPMNERGFLEAAYKLVDLVQDHLYLR